MCTLVTQPAHYPLSAETVAEIKRQTAAMAKGLNVVGLMNVQFAIQNVDGKDVIYVLEVNPRASRTVPYVSKATGLQLAKIAHSSNQSHSSLWPLPLFDA